MAPVRTEFQVIPTGTGWEIRRDGKSFLTVQTKQVAIDEVVVQAERALPSHVQVERGDGSVEDEAGFGEDPSTAQAPDHGRRVPSVNAGDRQGGRSAG